MPAAMSESMALERQMQSGFRAHGKRIEELEAAARRSEMNQVQILTKLDHVGSQLSETCAGLQVQNGRIDELDKRVTIRETAWNEQIKPAIEALHKMQIEIAGKAALGALLGGGGIAGIIELIRLFVK